MASDARQILCNFLFTLRSLQAFALDLFSNTSSLYLLGVGNLPLFWSKEGSIPLSKGATPGYCQKSRNTPPFTTVRPRLQWQDAVTRKFFSFSWSAEARADGSLYSAWFFVSTEFVRCCLFCQQAAVSTVLMERVSYKQFQTGPFLLWLWSMLGNAVARHGIQPVL